ncbi:hypothetical protein [Alteromonas sp. a30]|uniref:hypothetical protein n=1 Tax=Alteromonas sp. a30 TaxID=2730917 RepID=UPI00227DF854|nr:hypothetical protein [Alteromonas sp. a30]MCY7296381.1 hypothetical protein [Alteromonas sp. a30]
MSKLDKDDVLAKFTEAYKAAHGKEPQIEAKSGWYSVDGGKNIRLAQLVEMTEALSGGATSVESEKAEPAPKAKKKAAPAPKAAPKKKASSGFSVKAYWNDKITGDNAGSILPR